MVRWATGLAGMAALGCSFVIELDGPGFVDIPATPDQSALTPIDSFVPDMADAAIVDMDVDATPLDPGLAGFDLELGAIAPAVVHSATGQIRAQTPAALTHRLQVADGDAITVAYADPRSLITLMTVDAGGRARVDPLPPSGRATSMRAVVSNPFPDAVGYAMTNGCRHLRCMRDACTAWLDDAEMSLAVTDRCTRMNQVRTVLFALDGDAHPRGWAVAENAFPASSNTTPEFGEWQDAFEEVPIQVDGLEGAEVYGAPWSGVAYQADLPLRQTDSGRRVVRFPRGLSDVVEFGLDFDPPALGAALGRATQGIRYWRRTETALPVVFEASRLPPIPRVEVRPDESGHRPTIRWWAEDEDGAFEGLLARIEFAWETADGERIEWIVFADAATGRVRLPHVPDSLVEWRPGVGARGSAVQVTIVDCLGVDGLTAYYQKSCPILAPSHVSPLHHEVRWSAGFTEPAASDPDGE